MNKRNKVGSQSNKKCRDIKWHPPLEGGWVCLNSDGASKEASQSAGCGGVLREVDGQWVGGFAQNLGFTTAYMAERCGGGGGV